MAVFWKWSGWFFAAFPHFPAWDLKISSDFTSQVEYSPAIIPWMGRENPGNLPDHNWDRGIWLAARRSVVASTPLHIIGIKFIPCLKE